MYNMKLDHSNKVNLNNFEFLSSQIMNTNHFVSIPNCSKDNFIMVYNRQANRIQIRREQRKIIEDKLNSNIIDDYPEESNNTSIDLEDGFVKKNTNNKIKKTKIKKINKNNFINNKKLDFVHKSRHDHACRRKRNKSGRFLSKIEQEKIKIGDKD